ncbi:DNA-3-methyladenine glycosylase family protein [Streptomyces sp. NPDC058301]|uniref:DNA-3-methyladenine glycosylase family protein n=1 Tax=Streptomyces sp. NPDC058301 TaxID=3346436 RepID=UPI0036ECC748
MYAFTITPEGPFSLTAGLSFLKSFTPARYHDTAQDQALRLAFPTDDGHSTVGVEVRQADGPQGAVQAEAIVHTGLPREGRAGTARETETVRPSPRVDAVRQQLARILSLDVDGSGFPKLAQRDPVVAELISAYPGLRPVCFHSPYEAAAWAVIGHRIRMVQAATIKARIAEHHGQHVTVSGRTLHAFPTPLVLRQLDRIPGLPDTKVERLRHLADAALAGDLDASQLRAMPAQDALAHLRTLPGIGPFSAELILIRGAGHPDLFPRQEPRLHAAMARAYGLSEPDACDANRLAGISDRWAPYRSWVALLLRTRSGA